MLGLSIKADAIPNEWNGSLATIPNLAEQLTGSVPEADRVIIKPDGSMWLVSEEQANQGIIVEQGLTITSGKIDTSNQNGTGGNIGIYGNKVALVNANVDANGTTGGGNILIGGDYKGQGITPTAQFNIIDERSRISANAILNGDGGKVIVWADMTTQFSGMISAKGGAVAGNGGFAEVSGKEHLWMGGFADLSAPNGKFGTLLLDPGSVTIQDGSNTPPPVSLDVFNDAYIAALLGSANLTIATSASTNGGAETITVNGNVNITWSAATTFTLNAGRNIIVNSGAVIENTSTTTGFTAIALNANTGGTTTGTFVGILSDNATLATKGSDIQLTGIGGTTGGGNRGIGLQNGAKVTTAGGNIQITGTGSEVGIFFSDTNSQIAVTAGNGSINLTGTGGFGIYQQNSVEVSTVSGDITYQGTGTTNPGIVLTGTTTPITSTTGNITLTADTMQLDNGTIQSTGKLLIQPLTSTTTIGLGGASGTLNLNTTELNKIQDGFSSITIGRSDSSGVITVGAHTFTDNLILQNPNGGGISITGALSVGTNNLTLKSGGTVSQTQAIIANGLELLGDGSFTLTNANNDISVLAGNTTSAINYTDANSFTVGTVNSIRGIRTPGNVTLTAGTTIDVIAGANTSPFEAIGPSNIVTLNAGEDIILGTQPFTNQYGDITASQIILNADRDITVQNTTWLTATGANGLQITAGRNFNLVNPALVTPSRVRSTAVNAPLTITTGASGILNLNSNTTGAVQANGGIITLNTNQLDLLSGSVQSTNGQLLIQPVTASTTIGIGTGAVGTLNLDNAEIGRFADGFSLITIGSATGSGAIEVKGSPTFTDNLVLRNPTSGGIQILSALNLGTNNLTLNSGGIINQIGAGGITAGGLELLGSGSVSLDNPANNITTLAGNTTNNISFRDTNGFVIGTVNTIGLTSTGNITLNAGGAVTQSKAITANGLELLGSGTFTLTNTGNNINILAGNTTNNISYTDTSGFEIGTVNTTNGIAIGANNLVLTAGGNVTQSKAITATLTTTVNASGSDITLNNTDNDFSAIALTGNNATITDKNALIFGTTTIANDLTANTSGNITQSNALSITGLASFNAGTGDITLTDGNNDFSAIALTGNNATITDKNALIFGTTTIANNLTANASGNITQSNALSITGLASFNAGTGDITLTDGNNDFSAIVLTGNNATITDKNALNFGTTTIANNLTANTSGNITQSNALSITGLASFNAGLGDVILNNTNNDFSTIALTGNNATITDKNALNFGTTTIANNLTANTSGNITQSNALSITGLASFNAGLGDVILNNTNNDFSAIALTGNNATITDKNALNFGTTTLTGNLTANASGNITQSNALSIIGTASFNADTGNITLTDGNNDFSTIILTGNNATITDKNALVLGTTTITNNLSLFADGAVTQTNPIIANGLALLGNGSFNLDNAGNTINTIAAKIDGDLKFVNSQTLTVGIVNPDGIEKANSVFLQAITGNIVLDQSITALNNITLVADSNFVNNVGTGALTTTTGRFLVYATSPQGNVNGWSVLGGSQQFSTIFPAPALFTGNGFLYRGDAPKISIQPTISLDALLAQPVEGLSDDGELCQGQWVNVAENQWQWRSRCFN